jgi:hypothetical protein
MESKILEFKDVSHICEPKEKKTIPAGFYEKYNYSFNCIHCGRLHNLEFNNLTVEANIYVKHF